MKAVDLNGEEVQCAHIEEFSKLPFRWIDRLVKPNRVNLNPALFVAEMSFLKSKSVDFQLWAMSHNCKDYEGQSDSEEATFDEFIVVNLKLGIYHRLVQGRSVNYESSERESGFVGALACARKSKFRLEHRLGIGFDRNTGWPTFRKEPMEYINQFVLPEPLDDLNVPGSLCLFLFWAHDNGCDVFKASTRRLNVQTIEQHYADERKRGLW